MTTNQDDIKSEPSDSTPTFMSKLGTGPQRFLAHVIEHGLEVESRTAEDFVRHFPPSDIMDGLSSRAALRAAILEPTTGLRRKIGLKKSSESAGEDLQIALDEGETDSNQIVGVFQPDDRVRYLDNTRLWAYVIEDEFWKAAKDGIREGERAKEHIAFILDRALTDGLLTHADLVEGVSVEKMAQSLPRKQLAALINAALELGRSKQVFSEAALLETAAVQILVEDVSLSHIWETVVVPKIAIAHGLMECPEKRELNSSEDEHERDESNAPARVAPPTATPPVETKKGTVSRKLPNPVESPTASESKGSAKAVRQPKPKTEAQNVSSPPEAAKTARLTVETDETTFEDVVDEVVEEMWIDEVVDEVEKGERNMNTH